MSWVRSGIAEGLEEFQYYGLRRVVPDGDRKRVIWSFTFNKDEFPSCCGARVIHDFNDGGTFIPEVDKQHVKTYLERTIAAKRFPFLAITVVRDDMSEEMYDGSRLELYEIVESMGRILYTWVNPGHGTTLNLVLIENKGDE